MRFTCHCTTTSQRRTPCPITSRCAPTGSTAGSAKEPGVRLEVRHRRLLGSEFVVLADVAAGEIEAELLIPRRLVPEVAQSLRELHRYLGAPPVHIQGQLRLF